MFNKKVIITDQGIYVRKNKIHWEKIVGFRSFNSIFLNKFHYRFPQVEIFTSDGKVTRISNLDNVVNYSSVIFDNVKKSKIDFIEFVISKKAINTHDIFKKHFEWRILLPMCIAEIFSSIIVAFYSEPNLDTFVKYGLYAAIIAFPVGWIWEKKYRKKIINDMSTDFEAT